MEDEGELVTMKLMRGDHGECVDVMRYMSREIKRLEEENKELKDTIKYLENFIEFCGGCGLPVGDCSCYEEFYS